MVGVSLAALLLGCDRGVGTGSALLLVLCLGLGCPFMLFGSSLAGLGDRFLLLSTAVLTGWPLDEVRPVCLG